MVGNHFQRWHIHAEWHPDFTRSRLQQILEQVDFVVGMNALQHRRDTFQAHAGIDRGLR